MCATWHALPYCSQLLMEPDLAVADGSCLSMAYRHHKCPSKLPENRLSTSRVDLVCRSQIAMTPPVRWITKPVEVDLTYTGGNIFSSPSNNSMLSRRFSDGPPLSNIEITSALDQILKIFRQFGHFANFEMPR